LVVTGILNEKRIDMALDDPLRHHIIEAWDAVYDDIPDFENTFRQAFPPLDKAPWGMIDFDSFRSMALFAESDQDVDTIVARILPNDDAEWLYRNLRVLVVSGGYDFTDQAFSNLRKWVSGYPRDLVYGRGMIASGQTYVTGYGPDYGKGGYSLQLTDKQMEDKQQLQCCLPTPFRP